MFPHNAACHCYYCFENIGLSDSQLDRDSFNNRLIDASLSIDGTAPLSAAPSMILTTFGSRVLDWNLAKSPVVAELIALLEA